MYVLDTNILVYFFKGLGNVAQNLLAESPKDIGIPTIVFHELKVGIKKSKSPQKRINQLNDFISIVKVLPFGKAEAKASAEIRAQLEKKGTPIGPYDILIAGTALANQATLVTHNLGEFKRIDNLNVIDWY
jgi:tRNA(fMet)-specific endonuclease VapC